MQHHEIEAAVTEMIKPHEDKWRKQIHDHLTAHAERQHKAFNDYWSTVTPDEKIPARYDRWEMGKRGPPPASRKPSSPASSASAGRPCINT